MARAAARMRAAANGGSRPGARVRLAPGGAGRDSRVTISAGGGRAGRCAMPDGPEPTLDTLQARMLRKQLWVVLTRPVKPLDEVRKHLPAHLKHQIALEKAGIMYGAGPATKPGE